MELIKIKGNTYYIKAPTNVGVYSYKNKNCMLIDTGRNNTAARKLEEVLIAINLHVKYIVNTHSHFDHCGGNGYFKKNYTGCIVYASQKEKLYMENVELQANMLFSSYAVKELQDEVKDLSVDYIVEYGMNKINDDKFEIMNLSGHSPESIGIITPDKVCFLGDAIFSDSILGKYSFPYLYNIEESLCTLNKIKNIESDYFVISHAEDIVTKDELEKLVHKNISNINKYLEEMLELLDKPMTKEELLENIIVLNDLTVNFKQYYLNYSSMSSFISYLYNKGLITSSLENGRLYYYKQ